MTDNSSIRILTWNVLHNDVDRAARSQTIAESIRNSAPDIVCLQEAWPDLPAVLASETGMRHVVSKAYSNGMLVSLLSKLPQDPNAVVESIDLPGWDHAGNRRAAVSATFISPSSRRWRVTSTHLAWGSDAEGVRLEQLEYLDEMSEAAQRRSPQAVHVLCGDLNALPEGRAMRFMSGFDIGREGRGTQWVDAWATAGDGGDGATSDPQLERAQISARSVGIQRLDLLPRRRIDFVLVRGYAYGRPGCPLTCSVLSGADASDHHGIVADLWDPGMRAAE